MNININNFDTSTKGVNLSLSIFRDVGFARMNFRENFTHITGDLYFYTSTTIYPNKFRSII